LTLSIGRLLDWPALHSKTSRPADPSFAVRGASANADRNAIVAVHWLAAIGTSYLVVAVQDRNLTDPMPALVILLCLVSAVLLQRIPDALFERRLVEPGLLILDSILIVSAIMTSQHIPWDLLILFFFFAFSSQQ
jgi:hypothetical protein